MREVIARTDQWTVNGHHIGTTRSASTAPTEGVVDQDLKVHGVDNLYVAGASRTFFPLGREARVSPQLYS